MRVDDAMETTNSRSKFGKAHKPGRMFGIGKEERSDSNRHTYACIIDDKRTKKTILAIAF